MWIYCILFFFMTTGTVRIQIVVLLTSLGLHSIHIVNTRFLYNVPCVQNENVATGFEKWIAIFANSRFTDITSYMNIFCTHVQCAIDSSFKVNNDTCHIWSAEHPNLKFPAELYTSLPASSVQWFCVGLR